MPECQKIEKGGLDQYGPEHLEVQPLDTTGLQRVKQREKSSWCITVPANNCAMMPSVNIGNECDKAEYFLRHIIMS